VGEDGRKVLLALMAGSKEDVETARAFFQDLRGRSLGDPLLVVSAPITSTPCRARSPVSKTTSKPASPTCACP